jgi:hypothetical protein
MGALTISSEALGSIGTRDRRAAAEFSTGTFTAGRRGSGQRRQGSLALPVAEITHLAVSLLTEGVLAAATCTFLTVVTLVSAALSGLERRKRARAAPLAGKALISTVLG